MTSTRCTRAGCPLARAAAGLPARRQCKMGKGPFTGLLLCLFLLTLALAAPALAGGIARDLGDQVQADPASGQTIQVIAQFNAPGVDSAGLAKLFHGKRVADHPIINGATLSVPKGLLNALSRHSLVRWTSPDRRLSAQWDYDYDVQTIAADQVWLNAPSYRGTGVGVATLGAVQVGKPLHFGIGHESKSAHGLRGGPTGSA